MKKLLLMIGLLLCASPAFAVSVVQCTAATIAVNPSTTSSISFSGQPTVGNRVVIMGTIYNPLAGVAVPAFSDNQGNSYANNVYKVSAGFGSDYFAAFIDSAKVLHSSGTFTVTETHASGAVSWNLCEIASGSSLVMALDQSGSSDKTSGTSNTTTASGVNAGTNDIVFVCQDQGAASPTGYTNIWSDRTSVSISCDYKIVSAAETSTVTYPVDSGTYIAGSAVLATYKPTATCAGSSPTWTAVSASSADVSDCIASASNGDTINIPADSKIWAANSVTISKALTFNGAGTASTIIDISGAFGSPTLTINKQAAGNIRFTNIQFVSNYAHDSDPTHSISILGAWTAHAVIFNHCKFSMIGSAMIYLGSPGGLIIANSDISGTYLSFLLTVEATFYPESWTTADTMGMNDTTGEKNIYIEHNTFHGSQTGEYDCDNNCRIVDRYNTYINSGGFNSHGFDTSQYGMRHFEIYHNTYSNPPDPVNGNCGTWIYPFITDPWGTPTTSFTTNVDYFVWLRGGTGVIHDNDFGQINSGCWGEKVALNSTVRGIQDVYLNVFPGGCGTVSYPAPKQVGQGYNGSAAFTDPVYLWGNSGALFNAMFPNTWGKSFFIWGNPCGLTYSDYWQSGRDYILSGGDGKGATAKPGYTAYTYPHPLLDASAAPSLNGSSRVRFKR